jgi:phosphate transport system substrate-binding protein
MARTRHTGRALRRWLLRASTVGLALAAVGLGIGCRKPSGLSVSIVGSTSVQPFVELLAEKYAKEHPDQLVEVQGGGSTAGLQAAAEGLADIGMCSRALNGEESKRFSSVLIARDGLAMVVHPSNPVAGLSLEQLRGLFTAHIDNWRDVGGNNTLVRPITREEGSGTRESFVKLVMGKERISRRALTQESNGAVKELVKGDPGAIGYVSLGLVGNELRALTVDGAEPTVSQVLAGRYLLSRPFLFVTRGEPVAAARAFIDFVLSPAGQGALEAEGLVRVQ